MIGIGGLIVPQALGVGYETIEALLQGEVSGRLIVGVLLVKWIIWSVSLGSGRSGGVLVPLLMMGGASGGLESLVLPNEGIGFWPLVSMGAILGGRMRSPSSGIIFSLELTHDVNMLLPLLVAVTIAHAFTVLTLRRSILTEKVSRRGYHLSRESHRRQQRLYPVLGPEGHLVGVVTDNDVQVLLQALQTDVHGRQPAELIKLNPVVAYPDEPLRIVVYRMADTGFTRLPVAAAMPQNSSWEWSR